LPRLFLPRFLLPRVFLLSVACHAGSATPDQSRRSFALEAQSPQFWTLVARDTQMTTVATGFGFTEGPLWDSAGFLYVSDETINKIFRLRLDGTKEALIDLGDPDGNTFDAQHRLIDCASVLRALIAITPDGKYTTLADRYEGHRFNSPNDVVVGPDGALYFTDPTLDLPKGQPQETPYQGIYRLDAKGTVQLLAKDMVQPNGLAFSPDGTRLYVDDTQQQNIRVYDFAPNGTIGNGRLFGEEPGPRSDGLPDGMKVDRNGNLFVTGPRGVWVWDPAGHHLGTIVVPEQPANLAWGDADYGTLYLTAQTSVYRLRTNVHGLVPYLGHG
jgi:gluconolactonase